jgi:hypothetical protein
VAIPYEPASLGQPSLPLEDVDVEGELDGVVQFSPPWIRRGVARSATGWFVLLLARPGLDVAGHVAC